MYILPERVPIRGALNFSKNLVFWTNEEGGGLTQSQVFIKFFQNQICLEKSPEIWWNT